MSTDSLLSLLAGAVGVPVINQLKAVLGLQDKAALILAGAVSVVLSIVALLLSGELVGATPEEILASVSQVFASATVIFKLLKAD